MLAGGMNWILILVQQEQSAIDILCLTWKKVTPESATALEKGSQAGYQAGRAGTSLGISLWKSLIYGTRDAPAVLNTS